MTNSVPSGYTCTDIGRREGGRGDDGRGGGGEGVKDHQCNGGVIYLCLAFSAQPWITSITERRAPPPPPPPPPLLLSFLPRGAKTLFVNISRPAEGCLTLTTSYTTKRLPIYMHTYITHTHTSTACTHYTPVKTVLPVRVYSRIEIVNLFAHRTFDQVCSCSCCSIKLNLNFLCHNFFVL